MRRMCSMKILKNKVFLLMALEFVTMFIMPLLTVNFVHYKSVFLCLILLLLAVYPIVSIIVGIIVGKDIRKLWYIPLINFLLFPRLHWIVFKSVELIFHMYSFGFLVITSVSALITYFINKKLNKNK